MSVKRKIRRNLEKKSKKKAEKQIKQTISQISSSPRACISCAAPFDVKNNFHLDNWMIRVTSKGPEMFCDSCKGSVKID